MEAWWQGLGTLNKAFAVSALAFSVAFVVQLIVMLLGMDADGHAHMGAPGLHDIQPGQDPGVDHSMHGVT